MATIKVIQRTSRADANGASPLYLYIYHDGRKAYKKLDFSLAAKHWNSEKHHVRKSHPRSETLNIELSKIKGKAELAIAEVDPLTVANIKAYLDGVNRRSFYDYVDSLEHELSYYSWRNLRHLLSVMKKYKSNVLFSDITPSFLNSFEQWMLRNRSQNTASAYLERIRIVMYRAMEDGIIQTDVNPFVARRFKITPKQTNPTPLTPQQFKVLRDADIPEELELYRDIFLFSVYMDGMRLKDVLTFEQTWIKGGRTTYKMSKTGKRKQIQLVPAALKIVQRYEEGRYVFPLLGERYEGDGINREVRRLTTKIWHKIKRLGKEVGLDSHLHFHMARNTAGFIALENGWSLVEIQQMYSHSSIQQTRDYLGKMSPDKLDQKRKDLW